MKNIKKSLKLIDLLPGGNYRHFTRNIDEWEDNKNIRYTSNFLAGLDGLYILSIPLTLVGGYHLVKETINFLNQ